MQMTTNAPSASGRNRPPSNGAALEVLRGNDAGRGKPRLYAVRTGPFAGGWICKDAVTGIAGYGFAGEVLVDYGAGLPHRPGVDARERAYDMWDARTSRGARQ